MPEHDWSHELGKLSELLIAPRAIIFSFSPKAGKKKYMVVLGLDKGLVALWFINSKINENVNRTDLLKSLHLKLRSEEFSFLQYDSWLNCADLEVLSLSDIELALQERRVERVGELPLELFQQSLELSARSPKISKALLRRFIP